MHDDPADPVDGKSDSTLIFDQPQNNLDSASSKKPTLPANARR
jgi:hypothetical protein